MTLIGVMVIEMMIDVQVRGQGDPPTAGPTSSQVISAWPNWYDFSPNKGKLCWQPLLSAPSWKPWKVAAPCPLQSTARFQSFFPFPDKWQLSTFRFWTMAWSYMVVFGAWMGALPSWALRRFFTQPHLQNSSVILTLITSTTGHFLWWWRFGSDPFQTILSCQHCEYLVLLFCTPKSIFCKIGCPCVCLLLKIALMQCMTFFELLIFVWDFSQTVFRTFLLWKVNFAAVFAELLPHSELVAAERCGINLAQDLIDR